MSQNKMPETYKPRQIEKKWQKYWITKKTFKAEVDYSKPKFYVLDMFPYPSGAGLHVGHPEGYTASDIVARYKRMRGFNVLHPMGWDAFGLPAEQYALETGTHPAVTTEKNISRFKEQIQSLGFSYDWDREITTSSPDYYQWTQWIFCQLYKQGLAYMDDVPVNWCPELGTVLANEEVIDGKSERGGYDVIRKPMRQWMLKITDYADKLLQGIEDLDWPEGIKEMQRNWIGRSEGAVARFSIAEHSELSFDVFTTRPDTLFGATYAVLAPEHPLIDKIVPPNAREKVLKYVQESVAKSDRLRQEEAEKKTGVFTEAYAINPVNQQPIPIYVADYVLITYGSGAIMAVPAHDQRDWEFAKKFDIPIVEVVKGGNVEVEAYTADGPHINSGFLDGLNKEEAKAKAIAWLEQHELGYSKVNYKLRDWLFSRQRYWGEPFPIVCGKNGNKLVSEDSLPVTLPEIDHYQPTTDGRPPLARAKDWVATVDEDTGESATRETNTMPQWAGSCWYYLRYLSPHNSQQAWSKEEETYWMPVDLYIGGAEHAVLHLLYARFWHKVLYDLNYVSTPEPFHKLVNQGMILGEDNQKMSKSRGNVVNPDDIVNEYGADTLRLYEMFMGPLEQVKPWNTKSVSGAYKFLNKVWNLIVTPQGKLSSKLSSNEDSTDSPSEIEKSLHRTIKKVTEDIESFKFHTAISTLMSWINQAHKEDCISKHVIEQFVLLLAPFAPHLAEELWERLGHGESLSYEPWPVFNPDFTTLEKVTVAVQVNGKLRVTVDVEPDISKDDLLIRAKSNEKIAEYLTNAQLVREIVVPGRLVNLVIKK